MAYTALVRAVFEQAAFRHQELPFAMFQQMERSGIDAKKLWGRAQLTNLPFKGLYHAS